MEKWTTLSTMCITSVDNLLSFNIYSFYTKFIQSLTKPLNKVIPLFHILSTTLSTEKNRLVHNKFCQYLQGFEPLFLDLSTFPPNLLLLLIILFYFYYYLSGKNADGWKANKKGIFHEKTTLLSLISLAKKSKTW